MLDRQKHEQILKNILRDFYTTTDLEAKLAFKGGTCLYDRYPTISAMSLYSFGLIDN